MSLEESKIEKIRYVNIWTSESIEGRWPVFAQINAANHIYDSLPTDDPYFPANMKAGIEVAIAAAHVAIAEINALATVDAVEAYQFICP